LNEAENTQKAEMDANDEQIRDLETKLREVELKEAMNDARIEELAEEIKDYEKRLTHKDNHITRKLQAW
jgi:chromosome segregation ATPase